MREATAEEQAEKDTHICGTVFEIPASQKGGGPLICGDKKCAQRLVHDRYIKCKLKKQAGGRK